MKFKIVMGLFGLLASAQQVSAQQSQPWNIVPFQEQTGSQQQTIAKQFYAGFLTQNPSIKVQTAMVDLEGKGNLSIAVRLVSPKTCTGEKCHTVILSYDKALGWNTVFERRSAKLEIQSVMPDRIVNYTRMLKVNDKEIWLGSPSGTYKANGSIFGKAYYAADSVDKEFYNFLKTNDMEPEKMHQGELTSNVMGVSNKIIILQGVECDDPAGCRTMLVLNDKGKVSVILDVIHSLSAIYVSADLTNKMHDVVIETFAGYQIWRWNGQKYQISETTYPSSTTPAP